MIIEACGVALIAGNQRKGTGGIMGCHNKKSDDFALDIQQSEWFLPYVRFDYSVPPPPPPPVSDMADALLREFDGGFYSELRALMLTWYPPVEALFDNNETV